MKKAILTLGFVFALNAVLYSQVEEVINSNIDKVILFTKGAQIERVADVSLQEGQMILKIVNLSPYINEESIRVKGDGSYTIENVQTQFDYLNELDKSSEIELLKKNIEELNLKIEEEETWIKILNEKFSFLSSNKQIAGKSQTISAESLTKFNSLYGSKIETLMFDKLKKQRQIKKYKTEIDKLNNQVKSLSNESELPSSTVLVTINSKQLIKSKISLSYLVSNALWYPSYDIRFTGINKPLSITFKANIHQNTGNDWKDVNLALSTTKTNISAQMPKIQANYLQFYNPYSSGTSALAGKVAGLQVNVKDNGVNPSKQILLRGTRSISANNEALIIIDGIPASSKKFDDLSPSDIANVSVIKGSSATALYGSKASNGALVVTTKKNKNKFSIPLTIQSKQEISTEFIVNSKQTILSSNSSNKINFREIEIEADFEYQSAPKLAENAYLIGKVNDWYKAELLNGEASIYLEDSYVGKSFIDTKQFNDTLELSFGIDNNISVKREKLLEFSEKQFIGQNKKETLSYKLSVRNNKLAAVQTTIIDQIPISSNEDIEIEVLELSNGTLNSESGIVKWKLELKPNETTDILIKYSVKYPKDKKVNID